MYMCERERERDKEEVYGIWTEREREKEIGKKDK